MSNCKKRKPSSDAAPAPARQRVNEALQGRKAGSAPRYGGLQIVATIYRVLGLLLVVLGSVLLVLSMYQNLGVGPLLMLAASLSAGAPVMAGLLMMAFGEAMMALRDIARNSFRGG